MWERKCVIDPQGPIERLWHAGLPPDGRFCFLSSTDDEYQVADTVTGQVVWCDHGAGDSLPALDDWVRDGHVEFPFEPAVSRFRVFGLFEKHPLTQSDALGIRLDINVADAMLLLEDLHTGRALQALPFEAFSGDWAFASFSDDYSTVAVLEPYFVTIFRPRVQSESIGDI